LYPGSLGRPLRMETHKSSAEALLKTYLNALRGEKTTVAGENQVSEDDAERYLEGRGKERALWPHVRDRPEWADSEVVETESCEKALRRLACRALRIAGGRSRGLVSLRRRRHSG
jgi:hypothetical protein